MSPEVLETRSADWFDLLSQALDDLRQDCSEISDKSAVPSDAQFDEAKAVVERLRSLAGFPSLPEPNIWIGPNGELGLTWRFSCGTAMELMFSHQLDARVYSETEQMRLQLSDVPRMLAKLAA